MEDAFSPPADERTRAKRMWRCAAAVRGGVSTIPALRGGGAHKHDGTRCIEDIARRSACVKSSRLIQGRRATRLRHHNRFGVEGRNRKKDVCRCGEGDYGLIRNCGHTGVSFVRIKLVPSAHINTDMETFNCTSFMTEVALILERKREVSSPVASVKYPTPPAWTGTTVLLNT